jgi:hypothetical protein
MSEKAIYSSFMQVRGKCGCGAVTFEVNGEPRVQLYCHCRSCQIAHAAPVVEAALFKASDVTFAGETTKVRVTARAHASVRFVCAKCGTKVLNEPNPKLRAMLPALCETRDWFNPSMHIHFAERVLEPRDDLPKYLDLPAPMGGSGRQV